MSDLPEISVVVTTRNRANYLERLLDAVLREDYPNVEIVVVDGASTDGTVELLRSYGDRVRWVSEPDGGEFFACNKAVAMARGEIIKPIADDDLLRPGALKIGAEYLRDHPEVDIVFGKVVFCDVRPPYSQSCPRRTPQEGTPEASLRNLLRRTSEPHMLGAFLRKRVFAQIGPYKTKYVCGDVEFLARAAFRGVRMASIPQLITDYYHTGDNASITKVWNLRWDILRINLRYGTLNDVLYWMRREILPPLARWFCDKTGIHPLRFLRWIKRKLGPSATT